jgi:hypothetical protein
MGWLFLGPEPGQPITTRQLTTLARRGDLDGTRQAVSLHISQHGLATYPLAHWTDISDGVASNKRDSFVAKFGRSPPPPPPRGGGPLRRR